MTDLLAPSHADHYRMTVGRYHDRWYTDPLPACAIADATAPDTAWPSVSTIKKASGSDWSFVALRRVAAELAANPARFAGLDKASLYETMRVVDKADRDKSTRRGTDVHTMCESMIRHGRITDEGTAPEYRPAIEHFFAAYQPVGDTVETVAIHRTLNGYGYGGTADVDLIIAGKRYKVDWKSRAADSKHGAYPEDAAQLGAYAYPDYIIRLDDSGAAQRCQPPIYDGGLIVSIKPDGIRVYPIDLEKAWEHWCSLHAWWVARREERAAISRSWPAQPVPIAEAAGTVDEDATGTATPAPTVDRPRVDWIAERIAALPDDGRAVLSARWPDGIPTPKAARSGTRDYTDDDIAAIEAVLVPVERQHETPFAGQDPAIPPPATPEWADPTSASPVEQPPTPTLPDEGHAVDDDDIATLEAALARLDATDTAWLSGIARDAHAAGYPIALRTNPTERRAAIVAALIACAGHDDETVRAMLATILGDAAVQPAFTTGALVGALTIDEARRLADVAHALDQGTATLTYRDDGTPVVAHTTNNHDTKEPAS